MQFYHPDHPPIVAFKANRHVGIPGDVLAAIQTGLQPTVPRFIKMEDVRIANRILIRTLNERIASESSDPIVIRIYPVDAWVPKSYRGHAITQYLHIQHISPHGDFGAWLGTMRSQRSFAAGPRLVVNNRRVSEY